MKYEMQIFNKSKVKYIQKKYKVEVPKNERKESEESYIEIEQKKVERYKKILEYKEALDNQKIKEEDIPEEYREELREIYNEKINELQRKIRRIQ